MLFRTLIVHFFFHTGRLAGATCTKPSGGAIIFEEAVSLDYAEFEPTMSVATIPDINLG